MQLRRCIVFKWNKFICNYIIIFTFFEQKSCLEKKINETVDNIAQNAKNHETDKFSDVAFDLRRNCLCLVCF